MSHLQKTVVCIYPCFVCERTFSKNSAAEVINHVEKIHGYVLPRKQPGKRRPQDMNYRYVTLVSERDYAEERIACVSCWFHCENEDIEKLRDHIKTEHRPRNIDPTKNSDGAIGSCETEKESLDRPDGKLYYSHQASRAHHASDNDQHDVKDVFNKLNELVDMFKNLLPLKS